MDQAGQRLVKGSRPGATGHDGRQPQDARPASSGRAAAGEQRHQAGELGAVGSASTGSRTAGRAAAAAGELGAVGSASNRPAPLVGPDQLRPGAMDQAGQRLVKGSRPGAIGHDG
ncbi:MAG: hypothetical protein JSR14_05975 [Proteobacteria bacterium]|nr:hypothetical protein [Pseudomonadota bacterium]